MGFAIASIAVAAVGNFVKGFGNQKKMEEANRQIQQARNNLKESYDLAKKQSEESYNLQKDQLEATLNQNVAITRENQARGLGQNSESIATKDALQTAQIATIQVEASQAEGAALQSVATSGFRATGSAMNVVSEANRKGNDAISQALLQRSFSIKQSYNDALNAYIGADQQVAQYQLEYNQRNASLDLSYRQNQEQMDMDFRHRDQELASQRYTDSDFAFNTFGTMLGAASVVLDGYAKNKDYFSSAE